MLVPMELSRVLIRETDDTHIVELREVDGERIFPIVIGLNEAAAIERRLVLAALAEGVVEEFREKSSSPSEFEELPEWTPEAEIKT